MSGASTSAAFVLKFPLYIRENSLFVDTFTGKLNISRGVLSHSSKSFLSQAVVCGLQQNASSQTRMSRWHLLSSSFSPIRTKYI